MIPLKIDPSNAKAFSKLLRTSNGKYIAIQKKISKWIIDNPADPNIAVMKDLKKNIRSILTGTPKDLEARIDKYKKNGYQALIFDIHAGKSGGLTEFGKEIKKIFNYKGFRESKKAVWFAKASNIKSCATCNTQHTLITNQLSGEKLLFHLDHYFPQSVYPYLCLSYYNLIPCCASCNMSKSDKPFTLRENIHPYIESFHDIAKFKIDKQSLLHFILDAGNNEEMLKYNVELRAKYFGNRIVEKKLENYLLEFRIDEQYLQFKDIVCEAYFKSLYYNKTRKRELVKFFENSTGKLSTELINRMILGNYYLDHDLLKRPLAKFMRDIGEEFNLL